MGKLRLVAATIVVVVLLPITACGNGVTGLARVGDTEIEMPPFQDYVSETSGEAWQGVSARVASGLLDQYLDRQVVLEAAGRRDVLAHVDPTGFGPAEMRWLMDELCGPPAEPSPEEVADEVARRLGEDHPAQAHVRQLLVDTLEEAEAARERLIAGEDFVTVSREVSRAPNAMDGGELGFFYQGSLPEDIDEVIFDLEPGTFSAPVQGPSGYHVFQVLEVVPSGPPDESEVELRVTTELGEQGAREHTQRCVDRLASEIGVEVNSDKLWFPYDGKYAEERNNA